MSHPDFHTLASCKGSGSFTWVALAWFAVTTSRSLFLSPRMTAIRIMRKQKKKKKPIQSKVQICADSTSCVDLLLECTKCIFLVQLDGDGPEDSYEQATSDIMQASNSDPLTHILCGKIGSDFVSCTDLLSPLHFIWQCNMPVLQVDPASSRRNDQRNFQTVYLSVSIFITMLRLRSTLVILIRSSPL